MQRLFSTFPNGWPGLGLLFLRVSCAASLLIPSVTIAPGSADPAGWMRLMCGLSAAMILGGLWTPIAASCQALLLILLALSGSAFESTPVLLALNGVSLVMLGPGSWSIDARLYGRKRIDLGIP